MTESEKSYADTVAPEVLYSEIPKTADNVIRREIVKALRADLLVKVPGAGPDDETLEQKRARYLPFLAATYRFMYHASTADLLSRIQELDPVAADQTATHLVEVVEDGSYWPEIIWDWATARGIDPERIRTETEAALAAEESK